MKHKKVVQKKKSGMSVAKAAAIGVGVAAVGAGAYYFLGPKGKQHRGKAKAWMTEMEREVEKRLQKAKSVTEPLYQDAVDALSAVYRKRYKGQASEVSAFAKKLKSEWKATRKKSRKS
ncbi:MAG: Uncharacterized protein G01um101449_6 [Parcubacteria group bacterium Gr01-1014_49]|nr:MAG: Uncharacterized protein G01um101449_6 [Parcubacteria group bacterium Gr01-1014_49]